MLERGFTGVVVSGMSGGGIHGSRDFGGVRIGGVCGVCRGRVSGVWQCVL